MCIYAHIIKMVKSQTALGHPTFHHRTKAHLDLRIERHRPEPLGADVQHSGTASGCELSNRVLCKPFRSV